MIRSLQITALALIITSFSHLHGAEIPYLTGRVNDYARILSSETISQLTEKLQLHEESTTNQVVILTTLTLEGESIDEYAYRVFNDWKLGQKGSDNGVLIVVVPDDRKMRIEVGYGLESALPDITAAQIIQNVMTPRFREGDYNLGILDGADAVMNILEGVPPEEIYGLQPKEISQAKQGLFALEDPGLTIMERILIGAFVFGIIGVFTVLGILTPGFGWFLYFFLIPFWAMFPIVVFGIKGAFICFAVYMIGFPVTKLILRRTEWYKNAQNNFDIKGSANIGGFSFQSGNSESSWSSGSRSSGSSFSGGGGRSGGGGASGGW